MYLDHHKVLSKFQHGSHKQRSCKTQLLLTLHDFTSSLEAGDQPDVIVLDFSKAFDRAPHEYLCMKLYYYGIRTWTNITMVGKLSQCQNTTNNTGRLP